MNCLPPQLVPGLIEAGARVDTRKEKREGRKEKK